MISEDSPAAVLEYKRRHRTLKFVLLSFIFLTFSTAVVTTFFHLRSLMNTDRVESEIQRVDLLMVNLEQISHRMLTVYFNRGISEDFIAVQEELFSKEINPGNSEIEDEVVSYYSFFNQYLPPHMRKLNERIATLLSYDGEQKYSSFPLDKRVLYYRPNPGDSESDSRYYTDLTGTVKEIDFFLSDISNSYRSLQDNARRSLITTRKALYRSFYIPLILFLVSVFIILMLIFIRRYEHARIAELEARSRNEELERLVHRRTSDLEKTRNFVVEQEKMAALGGLVAGVAHEVNTPLGIGVTAASYISEMIREHPGGDLDLPTLKDASDLILTNLQRASKLIQGFKRVAADESGEVVRVFDLVGYLSDDLLPSINHMIRKRGHDVCLEGLDSLILNRNPGDFAQIVSNLVINASLHGYGSDRSGVIRVVVEKDGEEGHISVIDRGSGMEAEIQKRMYDPFFTTNRKDGGSGLGLMLVYNLVNQKLKGRLTCRTAPGEGTDFTIVFPLEAEE